MTSFREFIMDFLIYMGALLFWSNVVIAFIIWDIDNTMFRAIVVFAIMFMTGKYLKKGDYDE